MNRDDLTRLLADAAPLAGWTGDSNREVTLSSLDVILIVVRLYDQYGIRIQSQEIKRENFRSAEALWELCQKIMERK